LTDSLIDLDHEGLDGEFRNPWSLADSQADILRSGDGTEGGEFRFRFSVLAGDTDHDNLHAGVDYTTWHSSEPGMVYVSTTSDELDGDFSFGDVSLREAVQLANAASEPTTIELPEGHYLLTRTGTEAGNASYNDLDITSDVRIVGSGAGLTVIDSSGSSSMRAFELLHAAARLEISRVTIANSSSSQSGNAINMPVAGASLVLTDTAVVNNASYTGGVAICSYGGDVTIRRSVFTNNDTTIWGGAAVLVTGSTNSPAKLTIGDSLFALNRQPAPYAGSVSVSISGNVTAVNEGNNFFEDASGGFFDANPGAGDHQGTPTFVVTSVADTFDATNDDYALSLREAVHRANQSPGTDEIWLPAWSFVLTLDRGVNTTDMDVSYGDLDVSDSLVVRGVAGKTIVAWKAGIVDEVFDLLGDYDNDGSTDYNSVSTSDWVQWSLQNGSYGAWEAFSADGDDDGDVDNDDLAVWQGHMSMELDLFDVLS
jgi:hypothetical protein